MGRLTFELLLCGITVRHRRPPQGADATFEPKNLLE